MILLRFVYFLALLVLVAKARTHVGKHHAQVEQLLAETPADNHKHKRDAVTDEEFEIAIGFRPPGDRLSECQAALLARSIVNQIDWTSVSTISTREEITSYPASGLISYSDGPLGNGSGIPYFYLTPMDYSTQDILKDNRATLIMSLAQSDQCQKKKYDAFDPRCARVILTGRVERVTDITEYKPACEAYFLRHPYLIGKFPPSHDFFLARLETESIIIMSGFGGYIHVDPHDYYHPSTKNLMNMVLNIPQERTLTLSYCDTVPPPPFDY